MSAFFQCHHYVLLMKVMFALIYQGFSRKPASSMILEASVWLFHDDGASLSSAVAAPSLRVGVKLFKLLEAEPASLFSVVLLKKTWGQSQ